MKQQKATNVTWHSHAIKREERELLLKQKGVVLWFTGLSASGKSTIAHHLEKLLHEKGCSTYAFDGDNVRHGLCVDLGFTEEDRSENIRRIGEMTKLFVKGLESVANNKLMISPVCPAPISKMKKKYRYMMMIRGNINSRLKKYLNELIFHRYRSSAVHIYIDIDAVNQM